MPHVWYQWSTCPWPGCSFGVGGIDFRLETIDPQIYAAGLKSWQDTGCLVGSCPRCGRLIAFTQTGMQPYAGSPQPGLFVLPADWHIHAEFLDDKYQVFRP